MEGEKGRGQEKEIRKEGIEIRKEETGNRN